jgi:Protein-L-isoaspartate(D-aspartate) O-methyltransferase (PCMT)
VHCEVATTPDRGYHFHTGRPLARRLGYPDAVVDALPDRAVESIAGMGNPCSLQALQTGKRIVDIGSGAGFDAIIAAAQVGPSGQVVGVDMTFQQQRPSAAADRVVDGLPALESFEVAVLDLDEGLIGPVGGESDVDLTGMIGIGLELPRSVDLPGEQQPV